MDGRLRKWMLNSKRYLTALFAEKPAKWNYSLVAIVVNELINSSKEKQVRECKFSWVAHYHDMTSRLHKSLWRNF